MVCTSTSDLLPLSLVRKMETTSLNETDFLVVAAAAVLDLPTARNKLSIQSPHAPLSFSSRSDPARRL
jgi:hypothetical protein